MLHFNKSINSIAAFNELNELLGRIETLINDADFEMNEVTCHHCGSNDVYTYKTGKYLQIEDAQCNNCRKELVNKFRFL